MKKIIVVFGTRPEAIKIAPVINELKKTFCVKVCVTGQHREMLDSTLKVFDIVPNYDLDIMTHNQSLSDITSNILTKLTKVLLDESPDLAIVHGDTTTAMSAALTAFYLGIPVAHVEAGLRTSDINSPFPEEMNRQVISRIAELHFSPTESARENLLRENIKDDNIFVTGNTAIDSLIVMGQKVKKIEYSSEVLKQLPFLNNKSASSSIILVTAHRRENTGDGFKNIFTALLEIAKQNPCVNIVYPVHLNPNVKQVAHEILSGVDNIFLIKPMNYMFFVKLMSDSYLILTDSGGIQEEAPSLGKPVLVMRESTERKEAISSGTAILVGTDTKMIVDTVNTLLSVNNDLYEQMSQAVNPYGDGSSSVRIYNIVKRYFR